jgi:hypothetical protein
LRQTYQNLDGVVTGPGARSAPLSYSRLQGDQISFAFPSGRDRPIFKGRVVGETMEGNVQFTGAKAPVRWTARRLGS